MKKEDRIVMIVIIGWFVTIGLIAMIVT